MFEALQNWILLYRWCDYSLEELEGKKTYIKGSGLYPEDERKIRVQAITVLIDEKKATKKANGPIKQTTSN